MSPWLLLFLPLSLLPPVARKTWSLGPDFLFRPAPTQLQDRSSQAHYSCYPLIPSGMQYKAVQALELQPNC
ncbi:hypothetical protein C8J56DRAFT_957446 [Mycena floridula]|nr:hypothetical protein C8J56DRAFT_957446 [Mycena floridula]